MTLLKSHRKLFSSTWADIDLGAIRKNFHTLKEIAGKNTKMLCVVKANAYGHGMVEVARLLEKEGTDLLGVANIGEGILLRQSGIKKPILIFENALPQNAHFILEHRLTATVCTIELAEALNKAALKARSAASVHIKIDTGMGRLGVWHEEALQFIKKLHELKGIFIEGIYTHFPVADIDKSFTEKQIAIFINLIEKIYSFGVSIPLRHASNSMGMLSYRAPQLNLVRPGLAIYGMLPHPSLAKRISLKPALSVKTHVMFLKQIPKGRSISYGRTFISSKPMAIATLPIGYSDGYFRILSNRACVIIGGKLVPIVGRVTMDQIVVDVSKLKSVKIGDEAVVLGRRGQASVTADDLARWADTINYEVTCNLGNRLNRLYKK